MNVTQLINRKDCCGCNACGDVCAPRAISFVTDGEGFRYPEVDVEKCVDCGLCGKVCPVLQVQELKKNDLPQSVCYAAEHKNLEVVFDSTSGGMFSALADAVYKNGGYVGGAVFAEDCRSVRHFISGDKADLPRLRSSKYLQSSLEGFYQQVKALLREGKQVLVCGSPCQMAALRAFLGRDYENLIIADYICRGINSPKVWGKYLDSFEERYGSKVVSCKAKSKEYGWRNLTQKVTLADGKSYYETKDQSNFTMGYLRTGVFCRPSCYDCKFKGYPRIADITLADFWGIEKVDSSLEKDLGTSLVMLNSRKGEAFFETVKPRINCVPVPFGSIEAGNRSLNLSVEPPRVDRAQFFQDLDRMPFTELAEQYRFRGEPGFRQKVRKLLLYGYLIVNRTRLHPRPLWQFLRFNTVRGVLQGRMILPTPHTVLDVRKGGKLVAGGIVTLGHKKFPRAKLETRILVDRNATLEFRGDATVGYGADIEVFPGAVLTLGDGFGSNIGATVICGERIEIGSHTALGRHVTIRDNNGGHYMNRSGYRDTRPVIIGDKVWLTEQCTVMPGVKIGDGAVVGARSLVVGPVRKNTVVSGNPAQVVDEDILWKY